MYQLIGKHNFFLCTFNACPNLCVWAPLCAVSRHVVHTQAHAFEMIGRRTREPPKPLPNSIFAPAASECKWFLLAKTSPTRSPGSPLVCPPSFTLNPPPPGPPAPPPLSTPPWPLHFVNGAYAQCRRGNDKTIGLTKELRMKRKPLLQSEN